MGRFYGKEPRYSNNRRYEGILMPAITAMRKMQHPGERKKSQTEVHYNYEALGIGEVSE